MTTYTQELDKQIDNTRENADAIRAIMPLRAAYEDGFADGLGRAYRMVDTQEKRIAELEARVKELEAQNAELNRTLDLIMEVHPTKNKEQYPFIVRQLVQMNEARALLENK